MASTTPAVNAAKIATKTIPIVMVGQGLILLSQGSLGALVDVIIATATNAVLAIKQVTTTVPIFLRTRTK